MRSLTALLLICSAIAAMACAAPPRPRDPWVFRCVLDQHPRMVVLALHEHVWAAFDATDCSLYKVWDGDVNFEGAVYNDVHGPQPTSRGDAWIDRSPGPQWYRIDDDGSTESIDLRWRGYRFEDGRVVLQYQYHLSDDAPPIQIEERPTMEELEDVSLQFTRSFRVRGVEADERAMQFAVAVPTPAADGVEIKTGPGRMAAGRESRVFMLLQHGETATMTYNLGVPRK